MADNNHTEALSLKRASIEPLSRAKEIELAKKAAAGDTQSRETLIRANIPYALKYAKKFHLNGGRGLDEEEVNQEAAIGLIKAVDHFDFTRDTKVITLANKYIMNEIISSCNKSGYTLRQSDGRLRMILEINKAKKEIDPDCSGQKRIEKISEITGFDQKLVSELLEESLPCINLDCEPDGSNKPTLADIPDTVSCSPEKTAIYNILKEQLYETLEKLDPEEKQIICMRYGLQKYEQPYHLTEIGKEFGQSKQYIKYKEKCAIKKLNAYMEGLAS